MHFFADSSIKAVLCDVDGTLYDQVRLRRRMLTRMIGAMAGEPATLIAEFWRLFWFRKERERLRYVQIPEGLELKQLQYDRPSRRLGVDRVALEGTVRRWMLTAPLDELASCRYPGVRRFLQRCLEFGIRTGVLSDYPTEEKIDALGCSGLIELQLCSTEKAINAFKPSPKGILEASSRWRLPPDRILCLGDRPEIDGIAARRAGAPFIQIGGHQPSTIPRVNDFLNCHGN